MNRKELAQLQIGDLVTCKRAKEAYYSRYRIVIPPYITPFQEFRPGMTGKVGAVNVPYVTGRNSTFTCVDFIGDDGKQWRVALENDNIKRVKVEGKQ